MSGGTFDYIQYRIDDAVEEIKNRIKKNRKTILENWNEISEDEKECLADYEKPWSIDNCPYWVSEEAEKIADKALNVQKSYWRSKDGKSYGVSFSDLTKQQKNEWNKIRNEQIQKIVDDHNNSPIGSEYSDETIAKIKEMLVTIQKANIYLNRIDWLFAGDDGEDSFLERIKEDLKEEGLENS